MNICFDFDGTLVDSEKSILNCLDTVLKNHEIVAQIPLTLDLIGPPLQDLIKRVTNISDIGRLNAMMNDFKTIYDSEAYKSVLPYEGINQVLDLLRNKDHTLTIATNKRIAATKQILAYVEWEHYFDTVTALDSRTPSFHNKKDILAFVKSRAGSNSLVYIGDKSDDFTAAHENEIAFVGVTWGYGSEAFKSSKTFPLVHSPVELFRHLESI